MQPHPGMAERSLPVPHARRNGSRRSSRSGHGSPRQRVRQPATVPSRATTRPFGHDLPAVGTTAPPHALEAIGNPLMRQETNPMARASRQVKQTSPCVRSISVVVHFGHDTRGSQTPVVDRTVPPPSPKSCSRYFPVRTRRCTPRPEPQCTKPRWWSGREAASGASAQT